jgi:signal peptidase I
MTAEPAHKISTMPNGTSYVTLDLVDEGYYDNTPVYVVPPGHYFVMDDNRDNALDSRVGQFGYVPFENLIGRVDRIVFSVDRGPRSNNSSVRFERIGIAVR